MHNEQTLRTPGMLGGNRFWGARKTNNAPADNGAQGVGVTQNADLDIPHTGDGHFCPGQIESDEGHDYSASGPTSACGSLEQTFEWLVEMVFQILPGGLRSALCEFAVPRPSMMPAKAWSPHCRMTNVSPFSRIKR